MGYKLLLLAMAASQSAAAIALFRRGLFHQWPWLTVTLALSVLFAVPALWVGPVLYRHLYIVSECLTPILHVGLSVELWRKIHAHYPGIGRIAVWYTSVAVGIGCGGGAFLVCPYLTQKWLSNLFQIVYLGRLSVDAAIWTLLMLLGFAIRKLRTNFAWNVLLTRKAFSIYCGTTVVCYFLAAARILSLSAQFIVLTLVSIACGLAWAIGMHASGESGGNLFPLPMTDVDREIEDGDREIDGAIRSRPE